MKLTQRAVCAIQPNGEKQWFTDDVIAGLRLYVAPRKGRSWFLRFKDETGKRLTHKIGDANALTVEQAREAANGFLAHLSLGENLHEKSCEPDKISLGDLLGDIYEPWLLAERKGGKATAAMIRAAFAAFLKRPVAELSVAALEKWRAARLTDGKKGATVNRLAGALKAMLNWAVQRSVIDVNPIAKLRPARERDSDTMLRFLSEEERTRLFRALLEREGLMREKRDSHNKWLAARGHKLMPAMSGEFADFMRPLVITALNTGARRGGLFGLEWRDVDLENKAILFRAVNAKSEKPLRVPLNSTAAAALGKWRLQNAKAGPRDLVFPSPQTGKRLNNINRSWASLMRAAQIESFRFHDTRHDYASRLVMNGIDLYTVKELLGHGDIKMTQRYAHLAPEKLAAAVETITDKSAGAR